MKSFVLSGLELVGSSESSIVRHRNCIQFPKEHAPHQEPRVLNGQPGMSGSLTLYLSSVRSFIMFGRVLGNTDWGRAKGCLGYAVTRDAAAYPACSIVCRHKSKRSAWQWKISSLE
jgi:hypothetical protein